MFSRNLQPVTMDRHRGKGWIRPTDYRFAAGAQTAQIAAAELSHCCRTFPLAFIEHGGKRVLVALLGLLPGRNLFVAPDGRWVGGYIPAIVRGYPFQLAGTDDRQLVLCIDEGSGLVTDAAAGGKAVPFFGEDGKPHAETQKIFEGLRLTHQGIAAVDRAVAALAGQELLEPWPLKVADDGAGKTLNGLGRISEKKLNALDGEQLVRLREAGALAIAYAQLLSMGNVDTLGRLAQMHSRAKAAQPVVSQAGLLPGDDSGDLAIDWDRFLKG